MGGLEPPLNMCRFRALGEAGVIAPDLVIGAGRESTAGVGILFAITVPFLEPLRQADNRYADERRRYEEKRAQQKQRTVSSPGRTPEQAW